MAEKCIFCPMTFEDTRDLVVHMLFLHRDNGVKIGPRTARFYTYQSYSKERVRCICGERFVCDGMAREIAPAFREWALKNAIHLGNFIAHLNIHGGMQKHLETLREVEEMNKIARAFEPSSGQHY